MSMLIGPLPYISPLPRFEEMAFDLLVEPVFPPGAPRRIDGQVDGFNCNPDCQCPGCLMGFGCFECGCQT